MRSTMPMTGLSRRSLLTLSGLAVTATGCAAAAPLGPVPHVPAAAPPPVQDGTFIMRDGLQLAYRSWLPEGPLRAVALALHGMNDSRDAWEVPGPDFAAAGIAVFAPDQRGFGATPDRGRWAGAAAMTDDAAAMLQQISSAHPGVRVVAIGESMGAAVLMRLAATEPPRAVSGYVLVSPAVWGRAEMDVWLRSGLWLVSHVIPDFSVEGGGPIRVWASDNIAALRRLSRDPLTLHHTRFASVRGLVDLMDDALAAAPRLQVPALMLYGAHDELVPKHAMRAAWRAVPPDRQVRLAYYPNDYHLMLRDLGRAAPIGDILGWLTDGSAPLPSGADIAARVWLRGEA
jgi:acylglycerol lipase